MKRSKGYPKTQITIEDNTSISEIQTATTDGIVPIYMAAYTSDKGTEDWELLTTFENFTDRKGALSFNKHGQTQLTVANALTNGAYVYGKRMVSPDALLANATVKARVIVSNNVSYLYLYSVSSTDSKTFSDACTKGYGSFDTTKDPTTTTAGEDSNAKSFDIPLFTVAALGRGASNTQFIIRPEYYTSKSTNYMRYSFEIIEDSKTLENITFTMNPDIVIDDINQSIENKVTKNSNQVKVKLYEDGLMLLAGVLNTNAQLNGQEIAISDFTRIDFINGYDKTGSNAISGIVTEAFSTDTKKEAESTLWTQYKPGDIDKTYSFTDAAQEYIPLAGGTYGKMGTSPVSNATEYKNLLLGTYNKQLASSEYYALYDPAIYNVDGYKIDAIFDCGYDKDVKNAIIDIADYRQDFVFFADLGYDCESVDDAITAIDDLTKSRFCAVYPNTCTIVDPYTKKDIKVTLPYLLSTKLINHIKNGVGRPFAGINNNLYFPNVDVKTINFIPIEAPGIDQKQQLVDANINYLGIYDNVAVLETLYVNWTDYTQLSFLHNILAVQEVIKLIRSRCPRTRYIFLNGSNDLEDYIEDVNAVINQYATNFKSITVEYANDEVAESNNIFYAVITVQFYNFVQEEKFKITAIN